MESIRSVVNSITGGGAHEKEGEVAAQTAPAAQDVDVGEDRKPDELPSDREQLREPKNFVTDEGDTQSNSRPAKDDGAPEVESGKKDPAVEEFEGKKLSGGGVDGSHSAVFGLTPDGHKHDDTAHGQAELKPAHSKETSNTNSKKEPSDDTAESHKQPSAGTDE